MNPTGTDAQDAADMSRLAQGHDEALNELMERHAGRLYHYLIRALQDETDAEDLAQETFARVFLHRARFDTEKKFSTWLYTIATNLARDRIRHHSRHPSVSIEAADDNEPGLKNVLPSGAPDPTEVLELKERAAAVRRALAALPEELRVPLVLAEYENQSHSKIAAVLECSPKAVEMRIYHARQQLRVSLASLARSPS